MFDADTAVESTAHADQHTVWDLCGNVGLRGQVISVEEAAQLCGCQPQRILERLRVGDLPGVKFGHGWTIPRGALIQRLNELALEEAAARRQQVGSTTPAAPHAPPPIRRGPGRPPGPGKKHLTRPVSAAPASPEAPVG